MSALACRNPKVESPVTSLARSLLCRALFPWQLLLLLNLACGAGPQSTAAQPGGEHAAHLPAAPHSQGDRTPPRLEGLGRSSMVISTSSAEAQSWFDQGLRLLHCFWDFEAYRAFKEAIRQDPDAAMPYWGLYMSLNYNQHEHPGERPWALDQAIEAKARATARERLYIQALERLNDPGEGGGAQGFISAMQQLVDQYPEDLQAKLFLVKFLLTDTGGYFLDPRRPEDGTPTSVLERAQEILEPLLVEYADYAAVHHYWVHLQELGPHPEKALASAEVLPKLAPGSGHIRHMPGHVHFLLGQHAEAYAAFHDALEFDRRYLQEQDLPAVDHWNYIHNLDYLVANCAEDGRYAEGLRWAKELQDLPASPHRHKSVGLGFIIYGGHTAQARLHLRYGNWPAAAAALEERLASGQLPSELAQRYLAGLLIYVRGMEAAYAGDAQRAGVFFQQLIDHNSKLREAQAQLGADWYFEPARRVLALATFELNGTILSVLGQHDEAIAQLQQAVELETQLGYWEPPHYARPVLESLADAYLRARRFAEARNAYERELEQRPGSGHAWFGISRTWVLEGKPEEAARAMRTLLEVWRHADPELPQIRDTRAWLAARETSDDEGARR